MIFPHYQKMKLIYKSKAAQLNRLYLDWLNLVSLNRIEKDINKLGFTNYDATLSRDEKTKLKDFILNQFIIFIKIYAK